MRRIILKDIEQHAKTILIFFLSALILPITFTLLASQTQDGSGYLGVVFGYIVPGAPALFAFWFIGQEKLKGTFKFLSILPIRGRAIILSKSLAAALLCLAVINLVTVLAPLIVHALFGYKWLPGFRTILWLNFLTLFLTSIDITIFTLLETKVASQAVYLGHAFLATAVLVAFKFLPVADNPQAILQKLNAVGFHYWGGIAVILVSYLLVAFSGRVFEMREWAELEET